MVEETIKVARKVEHEAEQMMNEGTSKTEEEKVLDESKKVVEQAAIMAAHAAHSWGNRAIHKSNSINWGDNSPHKNDKEITYD